MLILVAAGLFTAAQNTPSVSNAPDAQQVLSYLNQSIDWYRHLAVEEQIATDPTDMLFVSDDRQMARQVVRLSFDFGRAAAQNLSSQNSEANKQNAANSRYQSLMQMANATDQTVRETQAEVDQDRLKLQRATPRDRQKLQSLADETEAELALAQARSETLHSMLQFVSSGSSGGGNLVSQVQELERSVPEARDTSAIPATNDTSGKSAAGQSNTGTSARREQPSGLLAIITDLFTLTRNMHSIDESLAITNSLAQTAQNLRAPLIKSVSGLIQRGNVVAQQADVSGATELEQQKKQLDTMTAQFKQLSALMLPLSKQAVLLDLYKSNLTRWREAVKTEYQVELKNLGFRLLVLTLVVGTFFVLGELWKRATFRYIHDFRRRYQFLLLRRIILWFVIGVTIAFALATEIGSLATFAGLITAGIAVALQNVILAIAGYFFLIGRYGVRVGDRVQISGVTGDVIDIGLVRLHLMEIGGSGNYMQPTGRVVVFSNSIVFQPTASFFKQIPGTNFVWHEVSLTLAPESDIKLAESRLLGAVEKVFSEYKERIEQDHREMQRSLNVRTSAPQPVSQLRLMEGGLVVVIRYPVILDTASEIDDRITRELLAALAREPRLRLVGSGTPNIQAAPNGNSSSSPEIASPEPVGAEKQ